MSFVPSPAWPHDVVRVSGPDARAYLHSQLSQDLNALAEGTAAWAFLLQPTGKVDVLALVECVAADEFVLRVDAGWSDALVARLNRFKIRVQADVEVLASVSGDPALYNLERVEAGWPAMGVEITEQTVPAELPDVVAVAVSFTKGCYPGQELVERMDSRGAQAPRHLERLTVAPGAQVGDPVVAGGVEVGRLTSVAGTTALALVRRGATLAD